jgi:hypothetical protein
MRAAAVKDPFMRRIPRLEFPTNTGSSFTSSYRRPPIAST